MDTYALHGDETAINLNAQSSATITKGHYISRSSLKRIVTKSTGVLISGTSSSGSFNFKYMDSKSSTTNISRTGYCYYNKGV